MLITFLGTLFLRIDFAVLVGILMSLAYYIVKTSTPRVLPLVPDDTFRHWAYQPDKPMCPQLGVMDIQGDLYFGAVSHIDEAIRQHRLLHPTQRFLLLRMHSVDYCDISGIHMLESIVRSYREQGGDVFMVRVRESVGRLMRATGFYALLGADNFLKEDEAIEHLFYKVLDPAVCIYESNVRVFRECQNLPRPDFAVQIPLQPRVPTPGSTRMSLPTVAPRLLWQQLHGPTPPLVIDVREPREYQQGHIPQAQLRPLSNLLTDGLTLPSADVVVLVCQTGRRSVRAAALVQRTPGQHLAMLEGGMQAWEAAGLLEAIDLAR
ncbi:MAG: hypothetical protein NVS4B8_04890 [Herpetosiphon sp.]